MPGPDDRPARLLDYLYGLLEADQAAALEAELLADPVLAAELADARKAQGLFAAAAKTHFPTVTFSVPAEVDARASVRRTLTEWAVAAGLLLAVCGLAVPTALDAGQYLRRRPTVAADAAAARQAKQEYEDAVAAEGRRREAADARLAAARAEHEQLVTAWVADERAAIAAAKSRPFAVEVSGPAAAVPGAPNEYAVRVRGNDGTPRPAKLVATVVTDGKEVFRQPFPAAAEATVRLPARLWESLPAGGEAALQVSAEDPATGTTATLREPVRLLGPVFATFLTTDKPLYRPGETVYFRSTTLDRTRLLPPEQEVGLRFELTGPDGKEVAAVNGLARVALAGGNPSPDVIGPDGRPVRGVGCGGFDLPADAPGGTYSLSVFEVPVGQNRPPAGAKPLARRVVQVAGYALDKFEKGLEFAGSSFAPGEAVLTKLTVTDQGRPVAGAAITAVAKVDAASPPVSADAVTAADGTAAVRFTLPSTDAKSATLSVTVRRDGVTETVIRPVPVVGRTVAVEFFPEGGDLIAGVPNRVYVRATTASGRPADIQGVLTDGAREICPVATVRDADRPGANRGLGAFTFTPQPGRTYTLKLDRPATGTTLPAAKAGVTLTARDAVTTVGEPIRLTLHAAGPATRRVLVGAYLRGRAVAHAAAEVQPNRPTDVVLDPGPSPLGGVVRLTVFEDEGGDGRTDLTPLAERLVFRRPKDALNLSVTANQPVYRPGDRVTLDVSARTEAGSPTAAVLWAAVVSRSALAMADDKADRLLPTHFLLGNEVRHPDELENADFLLTDHPAAATALDLLLGTQGWRRFAEQAPAEFRTRVPAAEADRLLASLGASLPAFTRPEVQAVADRYWPKYEAAAVALDAAQADKVKLDRAGGGPAATESAIYNGLLSSLGRQVAELDPVDDRLAARRWWLFVTAPLLAAAALACLLLQRRAGAERRALQAGAAGLSLVLAVVLVGSLVTADVGAEWRQWAAVAPRPQDNRFAPVPPPLPKPGTVENGPFEQSKPAPPPTLPARPRLPVVPPPAPQPAPDDGRPRVRPAPVPPTTPPFWSPSRQAQQKLQNTLNGFNRPADAEAVGAVRTAAVLKGRPFLAREYAHPPAGPDGVRTDFAETVLWKPVLVLPDSGTARLDFHLSGLASGYRVLVAGHTLDGRVGATTATLEVRPPLAVEPKVPAEVGLGDALLVPLAVTNTGPPVEANLSVEATGLAVQSVPDRLSLPTNGGTRAVVRAAANAVGVASLAATVSTPAGRDAVRRTLTVVPDGFPVEGSKAGKLAGSLTASVSLPGDRLAGGTRVGVTVYPNPLAAVRGGLAGLLQEPHGCFEQSSSANYPNVLALTLAGPGPADSSRGLLHRGYAKLTGFECPDSTGGGKRGFEWFGAADRPHPALSAYGLLQFADMARVFPVEPALVERTKQYLLSLRTGDGGFAHSTAALDRFGRAPAHVTDAYVVWAVSESERGGPQSDLSKELDALLTRAAGESANDPYFLALVGNACLNRGRTDDGLKLLETLAVKQAADGGVLGATAGITASAGDDLVVETTALAVLAWLKADRPDRFLSAVGRAVGFLLTKRQPGGAFGATQATVLALKALVEHGRTTAAEPESGELRLAVGGTVVARGPVRTDAAEPVTLAVPDADRLFPPGRPIKLTAETTLKQAVPAALTWAVRCVQPPTAADPPVKLHCGLDASVLPEGHTSRLTVSVTNSTDAVTGMAVAVIGLPAGLVVPADGKQVAKLVADGALDFWEVRGRELVLYWRGLDPKQERVVTVELAAALPGEFRAPASRAYLYYDAGRKHWVRPLAAVVKPAG
jgi:hypothetical protein